MTKKEFNEEKKLAKRRSIGGATLAKVGLLGALILGVIFLALLIILGVGPSWMGGVNL